MLVQFVIIDEKLPNLFTHIHTSAIDEAYKHNAALIFLNADSIILDNTIKTIISMIKQGKRIWEVRHEGMYLGGVVQHPFSDGYNFISQYKDTPLGRYERIVDAEAAVIEFELARPVI